MARTQLTDGLGKLANDSSVHLNKEKKQKLGNFVILKIQMCQLVTEIGSEF